MDPKLSGAMRARPQSEAVAQTNPQAMPDSQESDEQDEIAAALIRVMPPWLVSTLLHTALILVLAILTMTQIEDKQVSLTVETGEQLEDFTEIQVLEFEEMELEQDQSLETTSDALDSSMSEVESPLELQSEVVDFAEMNAALGDLGESLELAGEEMAMTRFFGQEQKGRKFVFVVDNSNSMGRGKFETALTELSKTVNGFSDKQQFHVIFFSDTAYLMFHPKPVTELVRATDKNKERLREWLYSVQMCLKTKGEDAMKAAVAMNPDVIYILGDGAFTDKTEQLLTAPHKRRIVINTLGMQVDPKGERQLKAIAKANKGKYRDVAAAPGAAAMAKQNPIKKNNIRGKVWGITLPLTPKKKK